MAKETKLPEGWLSDSLHHAHMQLIKDHDPEWHMSYGFTVTLPIPKNEQKELFDHLNQHFRSWTGMTLEDYIRKTRNERART